MTSPVSSQAPRPRSVLGRPDGGHLVTAEPLLHYRGVDARGVARTGSQAGKTPSEVVQRIWKQRWRSASVFEMNRDDGQVGQVHTLDGVRTWWAEL